MTGNAMIRKHLMPLLRRNDDVEVVGSLIMLKPIRHVLRGIVIMSRDHDRLFIPQWAVTHFCEPIGIFPQNWGDRIHRDTPGIFEWNDPEVPALFVSQLERDILPLMRSIETLDDMVAYLASAPLPHRDFTVDELRGISLNVARGDLVAARENLDAMRGGRTRWTDPFFHEEYSAVVDKLGPLLDADDREGLARQLHEWEAMRIRKLGKGMEKIWEPTPFPLQAWR